MSGDAEQISEFLNGTKLNARNLNYLIRITEAGTFSRAAIPLGVTQSVLSRRVAELEAELGMKIFLRNGRGLVPTTDGELVITMARQVLGEIKDLRDFVADRSHSDPKRLNIGLIPSLASSATVPLVQRLSKILPNTTLHIHEAAGATLVEWLNDNRLDLACLDDGPMLKRFNPLRVTDNKLYLACRRDDIVLPPEVAISELPKYPLVLAGREQITRRQIENIARTKNVSLQVLYETGSLWAVIKITDSGLAMSILPYAVTFQPGWQRSKLVSPEVSRSLCIATPLKRETTPRMREILQMVREELQIVCKGNVRKTASPSRKG